MIEEEKIKIVEIEKKIVEERKVYIETERIEKIKFETERVEAVKASLSVRFSFNDKASKSVKYVALSFLISFYALIIFNDLFTLYIYLTEKKQETILYEKNLIYRV
jgi:hypothetical protein